MIVPPSDRLEQKRIIQPSQKTELPALALPPKAPKVSEIPWPRDPLNPPNNYCVFYLQRLEPVGLPHHSRPEPIGVIVDDDDGPADLLLAVELLNSTRDVSGKPSDNPNMRNGHRSRFEYLWHEYGQQPAAFVTLGSYGFTAPAPPAALPPAEPDENFYDPISGMPAYSFRIPENYGAEPEGPLPIPRLVMRERAENLKMLTGAHFKALETLLHRNVGGPYLLQKNIDYVC